MADDSIVSRETMRKRGAAAFASRKGRNSHSMKPWAPALCDWLIGYDAAAKIKNAPASTARVDAAQVVAQ